MLILYISVGFEADLTSFLHYFSFSEFYFFELKGGKNFSLGLCLMNRSPLMPNLYIKQPNYTSVEFYTFPSHSFEEGSESYENKQYFEKKITMKKEFLKIIFSDKDV